MNRSKIFHVLAQN